MLCFSWDFKSLAGRAKIVEFLSDKSSGGKSRFDRAGLHDFRIESESPIGPPKTFPVPGPSGAQGVLGVFTFSVNSPPGKGRGLFRLVQDSEGNWKAFTLFTDLQALTGHEEPSRRPRGSLYTTWDEIHANKIAEIENDPTVLISS
jgi:hypothetical protein